MNIRFPVVVLSLAMLATIFGTPHLLTTYECVTDGRRHCIHYTQCVYIGVQGWRNIRPGMALGMDCPGVKFFALDWPLFSGRKD